MNTDTVELRFRVVSSDPNLGSGEIITNLISEIPGLNGELVEKFGRVSIEAELEKSVPIDPHSAYLVLKFVGETIASGMLHKVGMDAFEYLKSKIKDASIEPPDELPPTE